jgi:hypothetical protein
LSDLPWFLPQPGSLKTSWTVLDKLLIEASSRQVEWLDSARTVCIAPGPVPNVLTGTQQEAGQPLSFAYFIFKFIVLRKSIHTRTPLPSNNWPVCDTALWALSQWVPALRQLEKLGSDRRRHTAE